MVGRSFGFVSKHTLLISLTCLGVQAVVAAVAADYADVGGENDASAAGDGGWSCKACGWTGLPIGLLLRGAWSGVVRA